MRRATIIADVNEPGEAEAAEAWLAAAEGRLTHLSDQLGCGCCVLIWDIEGPDEVIATLPESLRGYSAWDPFSLPEKTGLLSRLCRFFRR